MSSVHYFNFNLHYVRLRASRFYLTDEGKLAEDVISNEQLETIIRERKGDKLLLTYVHNEVKWSRTFEKANQQNLKKNIC